LCRYFLSGGSMLRIRRVDLKPRLALLPEVFAIGAPSFTRVAAGSLLAIVLNNSVTHYGTDTHLAILGVSNRVLLFSLLPLFGIVQGLQPIIGFNYGAQNMPRVKKAVRFGVGYATILALVWFVLLMGFPRLILSLFSTDPGMVRDGAGILRILIIALPLVGLQVVGASMFQAIGKAWPALVLSMSRQVLFLVPLILALPLFFGLAGIWLAFPIADLLSTAVTTTWTIAEIRSFSRHVHPQSTGAP
ncbi:MAG: MATE family efflux transporter, partial [Candidatus Hydrogenedentes bacterium]|nr:MATE family efflux transporter [Candidatus Hydrogenedentota bacterium]